MLKLNSTIPNDNRKCNPGQYSLIDLSKLKEKVFCLTLDVEQDFGARLSIPSFEGLSHIPELVDLLKRRDIPLTCFIQGSILETHQAEIEPLATLDAEFELHSYSHPKKEEHNIREEIDNGLRAYFKYFRTSPSGYRAPQGVIREEDYAILSHSGFTYDSSVFPTFRPGIFNNMNKPTTPYRVNGSNILEVPFSVTSPLVRIPIALSYIKLLGRPFLELLKRVRCPDLIVFDSHLVDLFSLNCLADIPRQDLSLVSRKIFKRIYQDCTDGLHLLDEIISVFLENGYVFRKLGDAVKRLC